MVTKKPLVINLLLHKYKTSHLHTFFIWENQ